MSDRHPLIGWAIALCIVLGLALDQTVPIWGQLLTNIVVWLFFFWLLLTADREQQLSLMLCLTYATAGEIFLSLIWGLYDYRLGNIPLFVPPGHALLFLLGSMIAVRMGPWITWTVPAFAAPVVLLLAFNGSDTMGLLLFALLLAAMLMGGARRLYAVMFMLALAMELYGTWLGNWTWNAVAPYTGLTMQNPPLAAGSFYAALDLLVVASLRAWQQRVAPATA